MNYFIVFTTSLIVKSKYCLVDAVLLTSSAISIRDFSKLRNVLFIASSWAISDLRALSSESMVDDVFITDFPMARNDSSVS